MNTLNPTALHNIGYGLYVLTAREGDKDNGCIINDCQQVTDTPLQIMITVNKQNYTHDMIMRTGRFNVSLLTEHAPFEVFKHFGFQSGRDVNKFEQCEVEMRSANGILYIPRYTNAYLSGLLNHAVDLGKRHVQDLARLDGDFAWNVAVRLLHAVQDHDQVARLRLPFLNERPQLRRHRL